MTECNIYTYIQFLTFSRSHARTIMLTFFFLNYFFCYHYALIITLALLFAFKNKKHIPLCSHFFFVSHIFFSSVSTTFFSLIYFFSSHYALIFFSIWHIFFLSLNFIIQQLFFHYALIMLSRIYIFYFQFFPFLSKAREDPLRFSFIFSTFSNFNINFFKSFIFICGKHF